MWVPCIPVFYKPQIRYSRSPWARKAGNASFLSVITILFYNASIMLYSIVIQYRVIYTLLIILIVTIKTCQFKISILWKYFEIWLESLFHSAFRNVCCDLECPVYVVIHIQWLYIEYERYLIIYSDIIDVWIDTFNYLVR